MSRKFSDLRQLKTPSQELLAVFDDASKYVTGKATTDRGQAFECFGAKQIEKGEAAANMTLLVATKAAGEGEEIDAEFYSKEGVSLAAFTIMKTAMGGRIAVRQECIIGEGKSGWNDGDVYFIDERSHYLTTLEEGYLETSVERLLAEGVKEPEEKKQKKKGKHMYDVDVDDEDDDDDDEEESKDGRKVERDLDGGKHRFLGVAKRAEVLRDFVAWLRLSDMERRDHVLGHTITGPFSIDVMIEKIQGKSEVVNTLDQGDVWRAVAEEGYVRGFAIWDVNYRKTLAMFVCGKWDRWSGTINLLQFLPTAMYEKTWPLKGQVDFTFMDQLSQGLLGVERVMAVVFSGQYLGMFDEYRRRLTATGTVDCLRQLSKSFVWYVAERPVVEVFTKVISQYDGSGALQGPGYWRMRFVQACETVVLPVGEDGRNREFLFAQDVAPRLFRPSAVLGGGQLTSASLTTSPEVRKEAGGEGSKKKRRRGRAQAGTDVGTGPQASSTVPVAGFISASARAANAGVAAASRAGGAGGSKNICVFHLSFVLGMQGSRPCNKGAACEFAHNELKDISKDSAKKAIAAAMSKSPAIREANLAAIEASTVMKE